MGQIDSGQLHMCPTEPSFWEGHIPPGPSYKLPWAKRVLIRYVCLSIYRSYIIIFMLPNKCGGIMFSGSVQGCILVTKTKTKTKTF